MITTLNILIGAYIFAESFTAINEMKPVQLRRILLELCNAYAVKYWVLGMYGIGLMYFSTQLQSWHMLWLPAPAVLCVAGRTYYRRRVILVALDMWLTGIKRWLDKFKKFRRIR